MSRLLSIVSLAVLAACELQPAPKQSAAPPPPAPAPTPTPAPEPRPAGPPPGAGSGSALMDVTDQCLQVAAHIAGIVISATTDPGTRSIYERDREKMVRSTAETCTTSKWSDAATKCYAGSNTLDDLKACEKKFVPPPAPRPVQPAGDPMSEPGAPARVQPPPFAGSAAPPARPGAGSAAQPARPGAGSAAQPAPRAGRTPGMTDRL